MSIFDLYLDYEYAFAATQLTLAMLGMGATLTPRDFLEILRAPKGFTAGISLQLLGVPLLCWLFLSSAPLAAGVAIGLALCAAIPGGTVSNIFTYFGRGHIALSIALTAVATLACLVLTPLVLSLLIAEHMPADFEMPAGRIALEIGIFLLLPLLLGMGVLRTAPALAERFSKLCIRGSLLVILLIVIGALGAGRLDLEAFGLLNVAVVFGFLVVLTAASATIPRAMGLSPADITAINIEIAVRNTNLGLLIKASLFPAVVGVADPIGDNVLFTVLLYGGLMLLVGAVLIVLGRRAVPAT